jgi:hypothetical protein
VDPPADPDQLDYLLAVQDQLLRHLQLDRSGPITAPRQPAHHFYDLNLLTRFIRVTWPTAGHFAPPQVDLEVIDDHVEQLHQDMARAHDVGKPVWNLPLRAGPPEDPFACGHLLALAERLRTSDDGGLEAVFAGASGDMAWVRQVEIMLRHCSPALRSATTPYIDALKPPKRISQRGAVQVKRRRQPTPPQRPHVERRIVKFGSRNISHFLDDHHVQSLRSLIPESAVTRRALHRYAAVAAVRAATGSTVKAAAMELGFPPTWTHNISQRVRAWTRHHGPEAALNAAVEDLLDSLDSSPPPVDYSNRRAALHDWTIPAAEWQAIVEPHRYTDLAVRGPAAPDWGPRKRHAVSVLLWAMITRGDYLVLRCSAAGPTCVPSTRGSPLWFTGSCSKLPKEQPPTDEEAT